MTKEDIVKKLIGPIGHLDMPKGSWVYSAMDEYAKQQTVSFTNWTTSAECDYSCSDEDEWNNIHNPQETITSEQLYDKFIEWQIEQQNKS
jgi:hypothetical protein